MSPLHRWGEFFRSLALEVPLGWARALFVLLLAALLLWVILLPQAQVTPPGRPARAGENLKIWAALAVGLQILIYLFL